MNGKVWEKLNQTDVKVEPTKYHNIVGVNSHPINIRGSATVAVIIANKRYYQKFIIADNITAEGILGMDFMEANKCVLDVAKRQLILEQLEPLSLVPLKTPESSTVSYATISRTIMIPAASEVEVMANLPVKGGPWLIEGKAFR